MATKNEARPAERGPENLAAKLVTVRSRVSHVAKNGTHGQGFAFARWGDVLIAVRGHLDELGVHLHLSVANVEPLGGGNLLVTLDYSWVDVETGETADGRWAGVGWDKSGDKAIYKAFSGALKYLVLDTFMIPTGDDPEAGSQAEDQPAPAERDGAPRIPRDRAESIVRAAKSAGLDETAFKALLADVVGHTKVAGLNVDEAETVEARIAAEAA